MRGQTETTPTQTTALGSHTRVPHLSNLLVHRLEGEKKPEIELKNLITPLSVPHLRILLVHRIGRNKIPKKNSKT